LNNAKKPTASRLHQTGARRGDAAEMAIIELL
jgi:ribosomal protein L17